MIEAVGEQFWPRYFSQLRDRLLPGRLRRHSGDHDSGPLLPDYRREVDFIQRYVFPGGMLPSPADSEVARREVRRAGHPRARLRAGLRQDAREWRDNFRAAWPNLMPLGFDERFRRLWEYYLAYCEAGFLSGNIDVRQMVFAKPASCTGRTLRASSCLLSGRWYSKYMPLIHEHQRRRGRSDRQHPADQAEAGLGGDRLHHSRQGRVHESRPVGEGPRRQMDDPGGREARRAASPAAWWSKALPAIPASGLRWWRMRAATAP